MSKYYPASPFQPFQSFPIATCHWVVLNEDSYSNNTSCKPNYYTTINYLKSGEG